jgi:acetyl/propionyl-CoA carboxylase alpha subunit
MHTQLADEAIHIGGSAATDSYLVTERILDAARATGAEAIHPG